MKSYKKFYKRLTIESQLEEMEKFSVGLGANSDSIKIDILSRDKEVFSIDFTPEEAQVLREKLNSLLQIFPPVEA